MYTSYVLHMKNSGNRKYAIPAVGGFIRLDPPYKSSASCTGTAPSS